MIEARSQLQIHALHIVLFAVWVVIFAAVYLRERVRASKSLDGGDLPERAHWVSRMVGWPAAIALCSAVAGAVHWSVIREHFHESVLYGGFFLGLTIAQFGFSAWVVWRPTPALLRAAAMASIAVVLLWLATRTTGIPLGPAAGETEPFGGLDITASVAEFVTAVLCLLALRSIASTRTSGPDGGGGEAELPTAARSRRTSASQGR
jgi:hypothetical protein